MTFSITGRCGRSEVLDWLGLEPVRTRLGVDADGVDRLNEWSARAGIRFGLDASHRASLGLAPDPRHTWTGGIDRCALGHAAGAAGESFAGVLPELTARAFVELA